MKKIILSLSVLACFAITSCSSDDNSTQDNPVVESPSKKFEGKWKFITGILVTNGETLTQDLKPGECDYDFLDFKANGTKDEVYHNIESNCSQENLAGTWIYDIDDNMITTIDTDDNYEMIYEIIEISSSSMKIKLISDGGQLLPNGTEAYSILEK